MDGQTQLELLRGQMLGAPSSDAARLLAIVGSVLLVSVVLWLVRRRGLREEYTPIWMGVALALLVLSLRVDWLTALTRAIGAWAQSSTIFFLGEVFLVVICLNYAVRLSRTSVQVKNLAQEIALLRARIERLSETAGASGPPAG